jgi:hypothetical protein
MTPSMTDSFGNGTIEYRSTRLTPLPLSLSSSIFTADELTSTPISGREPWPKSANLNPLPLPCTPVWAFI